MIAVERNSATDDNVSEILKHAENEHKKMLAKTLLITCHSISS